MEEETIDNSHELEDIPCNFIVGIDLGTSNCAVSYVDLTSKDKITKKTKFFNIPQLIAPGELSQRPVLPSFLYLPAPYEIQAGSTALPWDLNREYAVGEIAREQGSLVPGRLVSSAKSWLCHGGVNRTANILPWGEGSDAEKVSPLEASSRYLLHIKQAWDEVMALGREGCKLEDQMIILTVPASFDEVARELTATAAQQAGLKKIKLIEEPLAAFYACLYQNEEEWKKRMEPGQLILVCDVGGGTTDFTIIAVVEDEKGLRFNRLSVGDHLMLGGDNMDLTIARHIEVQLFGQPYQLDSKRWHQLTHQCRKAKEFLLSDDKNSQKRDITLMGTGGKLIANTLKHTLTKGHVEEMILDGFFPFVSLEETEKDSKRKGLTEWGLPYAQNTAVTTHLAAFWHRSITLLRKETRRVNPYPDFLLFNGGALKLASIRKRIQKVVQKWFQNVAGNEWALRELQNPSHELAVAIGASNYGVARLFNGTRVGAGSPRAYYVEIAITTGEESTPKSCKAVCIVPRRAEEGYETELYKPSFEVLTNQPVAFNVFSSSTRISDETGNIVELCEDAITRLPPIRTILRYGKKSEAITLPVYIAVHLTEVGTLELWCHSQKTPHRWQLQFDTRLGESTSAQSLPSTETIDMATIEQANKKIYNMFDIKSNADPNQLIKDIVSVIALNKEKWTTLIIRGFADSLLKCEQGRSFTPKHEARWLNLLGFCLRPGFGDPLDEWRIKKAWKIFLEGLQFLKQHQCRIEWWILWRRVAGGLTDGQQMEIYKELSPSLNELENKRSRSRKNPKGRSNVHEVHEIWMTLASLERLSIGIKEKHGRQLLGKFAGKNPNPKELWALSRFGARVPFHGPLDKVVPAKEVSSWLNTILSHNLEVSDSLAHTVVQLARCTGDRGRDLSKTDKEFIISWFDKVSNGDYFKELLNNPEIDLGQKEQDWIFGETLPPGLLVSLGK